jgi:hypothetical protein
LGLALFVATSISMVKTLIVPRRAWSLLTSVVTRTVVWIFHSVARRMRSKDLADRFLGFLGPVAVIGTTVALLASFTLSFALMLFGVSDDSMGRALREAGSSVTTLGFESPEGWGPTAVDVLAGVSGLVVIALTIAYLPTLYVILRDRETPVKLVAGRVGPPVTGARVVAAHYAAGASDELAELYRSWETWAAQVADTHTKYPILVQFRLPRAESRWLATFLAVLDAAALQLALDPAAPSGPARLWLRGGTACLADLQHVLGLEAADSGPLPEPTPVELDAAASEMRRAGCAVRPVDDETVREWQRARSDYAPALCEVADAIMAPGDPWTSAD